MANSTEYELMLDIAEIKKQLILKNGCLQVCQQRKASLRHTMNTTISSMPMANRADTAVELNAVITAEVIFSTEAHVLHAKLKKLEEELAKLKKDLADIHTRER